MTATGVRLGVEEDHLPLLIGGRPSWIGRARSAAVYVLVLVVGVAAFLYPFWLPSSALPNQAHAGDAPLVAAVVGALAVGAIGPVGLPPQRPLPVARLPQQVVPGDGAVVRGVPRVDEHRVSELAPRFRWSRQAQTVHRSL